MGIPWQRIDRGKLDVLHLIRLRIQNVTNRLHIQTDVLTIIDYHARPTPVSDEPTDRAIAELFGVQESPVIQHVRGR